MARPRARSCSTRRRSRAGLPGHLERDEEKRWALMANISCTRSVYTYKRKKKEKKRKIGKKGFECSMRGSCTSLYFISTARALQRIARYLSNDDRSLGIYDRDNWIIFRLTSFDRPSEAPHQISSADLVQISVESRIVVGRG